MTNPLLILLFFVSSLFSGITIGYDVYGNHKNSETMDFNTSFKPSPSFSMYTETEGVMSQPIKTLLRIGFEVSTFPFLEKNNIMTNFHFRKELPISSKWNVSLRPGIIFWNSNALRNGEIDGLIFGLGFIYKYIELSYIYNALSIYDKEEESQGTFFNFLRFNISLKL